MAHLDLTYEKAVLGLANGRYFKGISIGVPGHAVGEVVFNTAMTGYQEILTDPSYSRQLITLTYPHIGNTGVNSEDEESSNILAAGLIIRSLSRVTSNWRSEQSLSDYLLERSIIAISDIDTRALTIMLRQEGAQNGCIITGTHNPEIAIAKAQEALSLEGMDLATSASIKQHQPWSGASSALVGKPDLADINQEYHIVVYDFGVKRHILQLLVDFGCRVTCVPATTTAEGVLALDPDGVLLSNGPGDPAACETILHHIKILIQQNIPIMGICLGFQMLALACGAKTKKMKFGHHGANHPVQDLATGRVMITSQNHSFVVDESTLPSTLCITHRSLFDNTVQGFRHAQYPVFGLQGHPEASPGPNDMTHLFESLITLMKNKTVMS